MQIFIRFFSPGRPPPERHRRELLTRCARTPPAKRLPCEVIARIVAFFALLSLSLSLFLLENKGKNWSESIYLARSKNIDDNAVWSLP